MAWNKSSAAALTLWFASGLACAAELRRFEAAEPHMGTLFRITLYAGQESMALGALRAAFDRVRDLDHKLSDYKPDSELVRLCAQAHREPVPVSEDLYRVLVAAQELARDTNGAFDVTLGPMIRLWRECRKAVRFPSPAEIREARRRSGHRMLQIDASRHTVRLGRAGMQLDLGGIGKGYAADEALRVLRELGCSRALVAAGGDLVAGDPPPGKQAWRAGVRALDAPPDGYSAIVPLANAAISTSGDTGQYIEIGGVRYSHILDPRTGIGLSRRISVTVIAATGMEADSLATALSVLGPDAGAALIRRCAAASARWVMESNGKLMRFSAGRRDWADLGGE